MDYNERARQAELLERGGLVPPSAPPQPADIRQTAWPSVLERAHLKPQSRAEWEARGWRSGR